MNLPTFTPGKFVLLALSAVFVALGMSHSSRNHNQPGDANIFSLLHPAAAEQDNGSLVSSLYIAAAAPSAHTPDRHDLSSSPETLPTEVRRDYPALAR